MSVIDGTVPSGRDPLNDLRADIVGTDPLQRAAMTMAREEAAEEHQRQIARYERQAAAEAHMMQRHALQRVQLLTQGHTNEELASYERERDERKRVRIAQLEAELARLDPSRRGSAARFAEYGSEERPEVRIARADGSFAVLGPREAADPAGMPPVVPAVRGRRFMQEEIRRYEDRCEYERSMRRSAEIAELEREQASGWIRRRPVHADFNFD